MTFLQNFVANLLDTCSQVRGCEGLRFVTVRARGCTPTGIDANSLRPVSPRGAIRRGSAPNVIVGRHVIDRFAFERCVVPFRLIAGRGQHIRVEVEEIRDILNAITEADVKETTARSLKAGINGYSE